MFYGSHYGLCLVHDLTSSFNRHNDEDLYFEYQSCVLKEKPFLSLRGRRSMIPSNLKSRLVPRRGLVEDVSVSTLPLTVGPTVLLGSTHTLGTSLLVYNSWNRFVEDFQVGVTRYRDVLFNSRSDPNSPFSHSKFTAG